MKSLIGSVLRKLRGMLGLGVSGAALGSLVGLPIGLVLGGPATWIAFMAFFGAATGVGFGVIIGITDTYRSLDELRSWQAGLFGGAVGALVASLWPVLGGSFVLTAAGLGAILTSSMVAMAKRAERLELESGEAVERALRSGGA